MSSSTTTTEQQQHKELSTDILTLTGHILKYQQSLAREAKGDLSILLTSIGTACKWISNVVRKAELLNVIGVTGSVNVQSEKVQKLDILSNDIMINMLKGSGKTAVLISEEVEHPILVTDDDEQIGGDSRGHYCVVFDPLDGSSNIDCGVAVGTIFGIYKRDHSKSPSEKDVLRPGKDMVAAGYCMYGSSTVLVLALAGEVNGYTLDPNVGEFLLTHPKMRLGKKKIYSLNEGYEASFHPAIKEYLKSLKYPSGNEKDGKFAPYAARYVGSMVADMHRTLLYGGIFLYPGAKLRLLYECFPMAMLVEAAGGRASDGKTRILDLTPKEIHDRSAIFLGTTEEVLKIEELFRKHA